MDDKEALFEAWLENLEDDEFFTPMERQIITADLCFHRELMLGRCADFQAEDFEDGDPEFMLFIRSAPDIVIEADDNVAELIEWAESVGIRVVPHFHAASWAYGRRH